MKNFKPNLKEETTNRCKQLNATDKEGQVQWSLTICDYTKQ